MKQYERKRANAWLTVYQLCLHWALRLRRTSVSKCKTAQHGGAEERTTIQFGQPVSKGTPAAAMNQYPIPNAFRRMRYQWWTARMIQKTKMTTKNRIWRIWQNGTETMTEHWNTLNTHCVLQHLQHFDILRKPTEMCSLRPVRHQWGASEATESSMSCTAWPTRSSQPARWSTNINRFHQDLWKYLECCCMPLQTAAAPRCRSVCTWTSWTSELKQRIWLNHLHLCNRHRRSISWDNFKIEAYAWFLQQNHLFAHWLPHAFVHFLRSTSTSMRGKHDNMTLSPVSSVCSHPTAWTITKQARFLRRSHLLSDVHTTEGNSLQSIKVQLATAVEHQAIVAAKETLRAVIEPLSQNCVRKKKQAKYPCWSVRCSSMSVFSSSFIIAVQHQYHQWSCVGFWQNGWEAAILCSKSCNFCQETIRIAVASGMLAG